MKAESLEPKNISETVKFELQSSKDGRTIRWTHVENVTTEQRTELSFHSGASEEMAMRLLAIFMGHVLGEKLFGDFGDGPYSRMSFGEEAGKKASLSDWRKRKASHKSAWHATFLVGGRTLPALLTSDAKSVDPVAVEGIGFAFELDDIAFDDVDSRRAIFHRLVYRTPRPLLRRSMDVDVWMYDQLSTPPSATTGPAEAPGIALTSSSYTRPYWYFQTKTRFVGERLKRRSSFRIAIVTDPNDAKATIRDETIVSHHVLQFAPSDQEHLRHVLGHIDHAEDLVERVARFRDICDLRVFVDDELQSIETIEHVEGVVYVSYPLDDGKLAHRYRIDCTVYAPRTTNRFAVWILQPTLGFRARFYYFNSGIDSPRLVPSLRVQASKKPVAVQHDANRSWVGISSHENNHELLVSGDLVMFEWDACVPEKLELLDLSSVKYLFVAPHDGFSNVEHVAHSTGVPIFVLRDTYERIRVAAEALQKQAKYLVVWSGYWTADEQSEVRSRSRNASRSDSVHRRGASVDVALANSQGKLLPLLTPLDRNHAQASRSLAISQDCDLEAYENYRVLDEELRRAGFIPRAEYWWHYDDPNWQLYPVLDLADYVDAIVKARSAGQQKPKPDPPTDRNESVPPVADETAQIDVPPNLPRVDPDHQVPRPHHTTPLVTDDRNATTVSVPATPANVNDIEATNLPTMKGRGRKPPKKKTTQTSEQQPKTQQSNPKKATKRRKRP